MRATLLATYIVAAMATGATAAGNGVEIGYVEGFDGKPDGFVIHRKSGDIPPALLAPIYNDDVVEVVAPDATIRLKVVDRPGIVIISQANHKAKITADPPKASLFSPLLEWASRSINIFDTEEREVVATNIRGGSGELAAPALARPQVLVAGQQSIVVGWTGARQASIRLTGAGGGEVANARASGGLWISAPVALAPGRYTIELSDAGKAVRQTIDVVPAADAPKPPGDTEGAPELRDIARAAWLAGADERYMLAALQKVAPYARTSEPARVLAKALATGRRPQGKPPGA
jgi:hypothetical protein